MGVRGIVFLGADHCGCLGCSGGRVLGVVGVLEFIGVFDGRRHAGFETGLEEDAGCFRQDCDGGCHGFAYVGDESEVEVLGGCSWGLRYYYFHSDRSLWSFEFCRLWMYKGIVWNEYKEVQL